MRMKSVLMLGVLLTVASCQFEFLTNVLSSVVSTVGAGASTVGDAVGGAIGNLANGLQSSNEQIEKGVKELPKEGRVDTPTGKPTSEDILPAMLPLQPQNKLQVELFANQYVPATPALPLIPLIQEVSKQPSTQPPIPSIQLQTQTNPEADPELVEEQPMHVEEQPMHVEEQPMHVEEQPMHVEEAKEVASELQSDVASNARTGRGYGLRHGGYMRRGRGGCKKGRGHWRNEQMRRQEIKSQQGRTKLDNSQNIETTTPIDTTFLLIKSPEQYKQSLSLSAESQDIEIHP